MINGVSVLALTIKSVPSCSARGVIVIDKDDVVQYVEYVSETTNEPNYEKPLEIAKKLV